MRDHDFSLYSAERSLNFNIKFCKIMLTTCLRDDDLGWTCSCLVHSRHNPTLNGKILCACLQRCKCDAVVRRATSRVVILPPTKNLFTLHSTAFVFLCIHLSTEKRTKKLKRRSVWQVIICSGHQEPADRHWPPVKSLSFTKTPLQKVPFSCWWRGGIQFCSIGLAERHD